MRVLLDYKSKQTSSQFKKKVFERALKSRGVNIAKLVRQFNELVFKIKLDYGEDFIDFVDLPKFTPLLHGNFRSIAQVNDDTMQLRQFAHARQPDLFKSVSQPGVWSSKLVLAQRMNDRWGKIVQRLQQVDALSHRIHASFPPRVVDAYTQQSKVQSTQDNLLLITTLQSQDGADNAPETRTSGDHQSQSNQQIIPDVVEIRSNGERRISAIFFGSFLAQHLRYVLHHRDGFIGFYRPDKWQKLRRQAFSKRQRAYDNLARTLTLKQDGKFDPKTNIAYGAGNFDTASPGYPATPNKLLLYELNKLCKVRLVPEF
ncbi:hypothetical protein MIR68_011554 [Amoeboaphelidium protococcarum]|nr:hypothetical protein MIR68_011554 [Amoeboaphelidium protococcarum]